MQLGESIRQLRKRRRLTLLELATEIESDVGNLSRIERGMQWPSEALLARITKVLGAEISMRPREDQPRPSVVSLPVDRAGGGADQLFKSVTNDEVRRLPRSDLQALERHAMLMVAEAKRRTPAREKKS